MKSKMPSLFAVLLGAAGLATAMAPAASAAVPATFTCSNATGPGTVCDPYPPAWSTTTVKKILIALTDHAAGGERCQLYIDGIGVTSWVYIDRGDSGMHYLGTVEGGVGFNLRCQRRAPSGDPNLGGRVYQVSL
ncbi:hypothetical protein [Amycolatopsis vastitatis]|uniref:hypothetical protein n=1 Tax=Amycolatopsis vastitatis TaxID=1905142 RepID=UPI001178614C|nr:hypothetical protein [Amycolatopsis vastitatis]